MKDEIKDALSKITPPPWEHDKPENCGPVADWGVSHPDTGGMICYVGDPYPRGENMPYENMVFIAKAPEYLRWCLSELDAKDKRIAELEKDNEQKKHTIHAALDKDTATIVLKLRISEQNDEIERLEAEVERLEAKQEEMVPTKWVGGRLLIAWDDESLGVCAHGEKLRWTCDECNHLAEVSDEQG